MLSIQDFQKRFGDHLILDIPNVDFEKGIHWMQGTNGSGKSTLFNCISGLSPFEGEILLNEISLKKSVKDFLLKVNYCQANPVFPEFLSGQHLINYFGKLKGAAEEQKEELKAQLSIHYADQPVGSYSSGMLKKLALALAFLGNPDWIILDEPLITLDRASQEVVSELIRQHSPNTSFLFATHQDFENSQIQASHKWQVAHQTIQPI